MSFLKYLMPDPEQLMIGFKGLCPKCKNSSIFKNFYDLHDHCPSCNLDLSKCDSADGPAVFLIFILGFLFVPLALIFEVYVAPPLWVHGVLWGVLILGMTIGSLRPLKAYIIALQYKHLPWDK